MSDLKNVQPLADFNWDEFENGSSVSVSKEELAKAIEEYNHRHRRFGGVEEA